MSNKTLPKKILEEVYSCPGIVVIGKFEYRGLKGYFGFPILRYRYIIIKHQDSVKEIINIPQILGKDYVVKVCRNIASIESNVVESDIEEFTRLLMYLGGYVVTIKDNALRPLSLFLMNTKMKYKLLKTRTEKNDIPSYELGEALITGLMFQEGSLKYCSYIEKAYGGENYCILPAWHGIYVAVYKDRLDLAKVSDIICGIDYAIDIKPENNPIRHVIKID